MQQATSWTRSVGLGNKYLFNGGSELNEKTQNYETFYRNYDAALGRFNGIDIKATKYASLSPYQFAGNNPVSFNDPMGDEMYADPNMDGIADWAVNRENWLRDNFGIGTLGGSGSGGGGGGGGWTPYRKNAFDQMYNNNPFSRSRSRGGDWTLTVGNLSINYGALSDGLHHFGFSNGQVSDYGWAPNLNTPLMNATDANHYRTLTSIGLRVTVDDGRRLAEHNGNGDFVQIASDGKVYVPFTDVSYWDYSSARQNGTNNTSEGNWFTNGTGFGHEYNENLTLGLSAASAGVGIIESGVAIGTFQSLKNITYTTAKTGLKVVKASGAVGAILGGGVIIHEVATGKDNTHTWVDAGVMVAGAVAVGVIGTAALPVVAILGIGYGIFSAAGGSDLIDDKWGYRDPTTGKIK